MSILTRFLAACAIVAFSVGPVSAATVSNASTTVAQGTAGATTGGISGTAVDETGAPVAGATVTVRGQKTYSGTTDAKGSFSISNIPPGVYLVSVSKAGYDTATSPDVAIFSGETATYSITMHTATLTSLRTIASVRVGARSSFNTSTASVNTISAATYLNQGQTQVTHVLNQLPGVQISLPSNSANGSVPGAITFPNVRNGLSFETASLIDGHPLSVGLYGDYVTTFLNPAVFGTTDVIKGPGAMAPQVNYAIGGTVNFRTKDPTATVTPSYTFGFTNHGGSFYDLGVSNTLGRFGFVAEIAGESDPSALNGQSYYFDPGAGNVALLNGKELFDSPSKQYVPYTASTLNNGYHLIACCAQLYGDYNNQTVLLKGRYKLSSATTFTGSYLGGVSYANQSGNTSELSANSAFAPGAAYNPAGGLAKGPIPALYSFYYSGGQGEKEVNNEPILQGEILTTLNKDTILARYYHATINRQKYYGTNPLTPENVTLPMWGTVSGFPGSFQGTPQTIQVYDYYDNPELDQLAGWSFQYDHPITQGNGDIALSVDSTHSQTIVKSTSVSYNFNGQQCPYNEAATLCANTSTSLPSGASQNFTTVLLRGHEQLGQKLSATLSLYQNIYQNTYPTNCGGSTTTSTAATITTTGICTPAGFLDTTVYTKATKATTVSSVPVNFTQTTTTHFDPRLGLEYRLRPDVALRFSMGSAIAPPYINLLSQANGSLSYNSSQGIAYQTINAGGFLKPETAWGYDLGADVRLKDKVTFVSGDVYMTNLYNQFIKQTYDSGNTCATAGITCPGAAAGSSAVPVYYTSNVNLSNARYKGLELSIRRIPDHGLGYVLQGSTQTGYVYNLGPCFYSTVAASAPGGCNYGTNLAILPNQNYTGGGIGFNGVSNQSVPYLQGNAEVNYTMTNGAFFAFGDTLYGKNNSLNEPPFGIAYLTARYPLTHSLSLQISGDNIFNAWSGVIPVYGGGLAVPLAGVPAGAPAGTLAQGATLGNVVGPATWRFMLTKNIGPEPVNQ